jgi:hypothetical protein
MKNQEDMDYSAYRALGGIINENDYICALKKTAEAAPNEFVTTKRQAVMIARIAGIKLGGEYTDKRIVLYSILRNDVVENAEVKHHHCQMSDQRLFAETLRMLGDVKSLKKMISTFPNIDLG